MIKINIFVTVATILKVSFTMKAAREVCNVETVITSSSHQTACSDTPTVNWESSEAGYEVNKAFVDNVDDAANNYWQGIHSPTSEGGSGSVSY